MTYFKTWKDAHAWYQDASSAYKATVDACFELINDRLGQDGFSRAYDDRAEKLIAAIVTYIEDSRK
jgi:hypothetical protein